MKTLPPLVLLAASSPSATTPSGTTPRCWRGCSSTPAASAGTALVVSGHRREVLGDNSVTFFDYRANPPVTVVLPARRTCDLEARAPLGD